MIYIIHDEFGSGLECIVDTDLPGEIISGYMKEHKQIIDAYWNSYHAHAAEFDKLHGTEDWSPEMSEARYEHMQGYDKTHTFQTLPEYLESKGLNLVSYVELVVS